MKLSQLVEYLNLLQQENHVPEYTKAINQLHGLANTVQTYPVQLETFSADLIQHVAAVETAFDRAQILLSDFQTKLRHLIEQLESQAYIESQRVYEQEMCFDTTDIILNRKLVIDNENKMLLHARLKTYTDWRLPGMIIRPGCESYIEDLVPLDPMYVVDQSTELLQPAIAGFTPEYQRRLRCYTIDDYRDGRILWQLPDNQFGFIFVYNYFNYKPIEVLSRYLTEIFQKLRPGGVCLFTFNDCDQSHGVALAERNFMCYTPGRVVKAQVEKLGFEILYHHEGIGSATWLEIKRPGVITSLRGGQSLAKIIAQP